MYSLCFVPLLVLMLVMIVTTLFPNEMPFGAYIARCFHWIPWVGPAQEMAACAEFCSRLAVLVDCRVPLEEALRIVSFTLQDSHLQRIARKLSDRMEAGASTDDISTTSFGIPSSLANAFRWAKDPEMFSDGLKSLSHIIQLTSQARDEPTRCHCWPHCLRNGWAGSRIFRHCFVLAPHHSPQRTFIGSNGTTPFSTRDSFQLHF